MFLCRKIRVTPQTTIALLFESHHKFTTKASKTLQLYAQPSLSITHGQGCYLYDANGHKYLDMTAGIAVNALGHNDPDVIQVISEQSKKLIHLSNLYQNDTVQSYAGQLSSSTSCGRLGCTGTGSCTTCTPLAKGNLFEAKVFFCNSGTEANEAAIKFARRYGKSVSPNKNKIISFLNAFHGRTMGSLSATPNPKYQAPFGPLVPNFAYGKLNEIDPNLIDNDVCAVIVEPIQGEGGIFPANKSFLEFLRKECDRVNAVLVFDEIQCGVGRTGTMFAYEQLGIVPDIVTMAKPLANGIPIGAVLISRKVGSTIKAGDHGTTFGGSPFATAVGQVVWSKISSPAFLSHIQDMGNLLLRECKNIQQMSSLITQVRGVGLMIGLQLRDGIPTATVIDQCRKERLLVISAGANTIRLVPPLIISKEEIQQAVDILRGVLLSIEG